MTEAPERTNFRLANPEDAQAPWMWDAMHCPRPLPPLAGDGWLLWCATGIGMRAQMVNGYCYLSFGGGGPGMGAGVPAPPAGLTPREAWERHYLPPVVNFVTGINARDFDAIPARELAARLREVVDGSTSAFAHTMAALGGVTEPLAAFVRFCESAFGADGALRAMTMLQGFDNASADAGAGLGRLGAMAAGLPAVREAILGGDHARLATVDGGAEFLDALSRYLDEFGIGTQTWFEIHRPTWREDPSVPLRLIGRYLQGGGSPAGAHGHAADVRDEAIRAAAAALGDASQVEEFRALLAGAGDYVSVIEGRARWQLACAATVRRPSIALGRKLATSGEIEAADDVFFLHLAEVDAYGNGEALPGRDEIARRKAAFASWQEVLPPRFLGQAVPEGVLANIPELRQLTGLGVLASTEPGILRGNGSSRGVVRARARVVLDLDDAERVEPGDVLVCPFTAPPWTPYFAVASAVVTDAGGVLSHAAIAAREYGIPCVTGTKDGTRRIADGAIVTVDGTEGIVRIDEV
ncbi:MAG: hypothetical protein HY875_01710 [Chloroflexi bacterium]|nr:hypothetical protein [Chloroflexota bacterium]